jgi:HPt (histidine-containing phosphotransfer) domain-containing protein
LIGTIEKNLAAPPRLQRSVRSQEHNLAERISQDDSGFVNGILQVFLQLAPERMDRLQTAAGRADSGTVEQEARMIGAAAQQLASQGLGDCAKRIEEAASKGDFDQVKMDLATLRQEIQSLETLTTQ